MTRIERRFWEIITRFGALPGIFVPIWVIGMLHLFTSHNLLLEIRDAYTIPQQSLIVMWFALVGIGISYSIGLMIKYIYYKPRPIPLLTNTRWQKIAASSFPSIHCSNAMIIRISWIVSVIWTTQSRWWMLFIIILWFTLYLSIALSRIALDKHFPIDVLIGSVMGLIISLVLIGCAPYIEYLIIASQFI